ncbi:hypothetical protein [Streptomyces sp. NPDC086787]|uniref:hypothetical protein n=1 Tax=Streptomyces sp. NPDC086787 TaxID=3365759 RepID=UPI00382B0B56
MDAATTRAKNTRKAVVVDGLTTDNAQTVANPDGTFTMTQNAEPVRARHNGSWVAIDTRLVKRADGGFAARADIADIEFSGGGTAPLVRMARDGKQVALTWPTALPTPVVSGDTATYREVLPGVDLAMTARRDGFGEVLVVKTPAAAANPKLASLKLGTRTVGLTLRQGADGSATATDSAGTTVFRADRPLVWDSSAAVPGTTPPRHATRPVPGARVPAASVRSADRAAVAAPAAGTAKAPAGDPTRSDFRRPGSHAHVTTMPAKLDKAHLTLAPGAFLKSAKSLTFPLYVDPAWSGNPSVSAWAAINSNGGKWTSGDDAPLGLNNWSGCGSWCGSVGRAYFEMNASGFQGAKVTDAHFYPYFTWAANSAAEPTQIWLDPDFPSNLSWSNKPTSSSPSTYVTEVKSCIGHHSSSGCPQGTVDFTVTSAAQTAAGGGRRDLEVDAADEGDTYQWKRIDPSRTKWSVTYFRAPTINSCCSTSPTVTDGGTTFATSGNPTMKALGTDSDGENVRTGYELSNWANGAATTSVKTGMYSAYSSTGAAFTYNGAALTDGNTYAWRAVSESQQGDMSSAWTGWQVFKVDTQAPNPPTVSSPQFPAKMYGASLSDVGGFDFTNDLTDNVKGYIFSMDGDLGSTVYNAASPPPTWTGSGTPAAGKVYWLTADNGNGTGAVKVNAPARATLTPKTAGPHRIFAKAVDQAGHTSGESVDLFYAGVTTPSYAYGDQLINGCAVNTCNGNTAAVPAATATVGNKATLITQNNCCNVFFADGKQAMLSDGGGAVAQGDTATLSFWVPRTDSYGIGANLTRSYDYGQYDLVLDKGTSHAWTLASGIDAYAAQVSTVYRDFGVPKDSSGAPMMLSAGLHTLTVAVSGKNSSSGGYQWGLDVLRIAPTPARCTITDLSQCQNNTAISPDGNGASAGYGADDDVSPATLSAGDLTAAGWKPGASVTVNGAPMTLPAYQTGKPDNIAAGGQTIDLSSLTGAANSGNALVFLGFGTNGDIDGASGTITYATPCYGNSTQGYTIDSMPDWVRGPATAAALQMKHRNFYNGTQDTSNPRMYAVSVPLACPGAAIASVTLPVVSNGVSYGSPALHIMTVGIRPASYTDSGMSQNWTASFGARQDAHLGDFADRSVRMAVRLSLGGSQVRLHLSNALGTAPIGFDHVTAALQSAARSAVPTGTPVEARFKGSTSVTIPAGGDVTSDPVTLTVEQRQTLLVSLHLSAGTADAVGHTNAKTTSWYSAAGVDATMDTTAANFTSSMDNVDWLTAVDVTSGGNTTGALVLYGDHTVNSDTVTPDGAHHLADVIADRVSSANGGTLPYAVVSEGQDNWTTSSNLLPVVANQPNPGNAGNPLDAHVLAQSNVRTVLISTGTSDLLAGTAAPDLENRLAALAQQLRKYYADTSGSNSNGFVTVYVATIPPDSRFTAAQEAVRQTVNGYILSKDGNDSYLNGNADGAVDFAAAVSDTGTGAGSAVKPAYLYLDTSSNTYYPNDSYIAALAAQYTKSVGSTVHIQPNRANVKSLSPRRG